MNKSALSSFVSLCILFISCTEKSTPAWIEKYPHAISPDIKVVIYQSFTNQTEGVEIVVHTHIASWLTSGGGSIFNIRLPMADTLKLIWTSDSTATIQYPAHAKIFKQEDTDYFFGRRIHFTYQPE